MRLLKVIEEIECEDAKIDDSATWKLAGWATELRKIWEAIALYGEYFGYSPEYEYDDLDLLKGWYCMWPKCLQELGRPHLVGCPIGAIESDRDENSCGECGEPIPCSGFHPAVPKENL